MRISPRFLAILSVWLLMCLPSFAQSQSSYQVEVAVADKGEVEQKEAYQVAMRRVLLSNSADKTLLNRDDVRAGINVADTFVESFNYRSPEPGTVISRATPITDLVRRTGEATQIMTIAFDAARIQELINANKPDNNENEAASVAGLQNVRSALAWFLVQDGRSDLLVGGDVGENVMQRAREIAGGNGITLSFPRGDQTDLSSLTADQLRARDEQAIANTATRYAAPAVLSAYLVRKRSRGWLGLWSKLAGSDAEHQEFEADTLDELLEKGIAWLASTSAEAATYEYGGAASTASEGLIWVNTVSATADYARVMSFLDSIDSVATAYPKEIGRDGTLFVVVPRTALNAVANRAASLSWLRRSVPPSGTGLASQAELAFDFLR